MHLVHKVIKPGVFGWRIGIRVAVNAVIQIRAAGRLAACAALLLLHQFAGQCHDLIQGRLVFFRQRQRLAHHAHKVLPEAFPFERAGGRHTAQLGLEPGIRHGLSDKLKHVSAAIFSLDGRVLCDGVVQQRLGAAAQQWPLDQRVCCSGMHAFVQQRVG